ncbi:hypothetical protein BGW38_007250 [Lunasporangiospora selenospora]|uniref:MIT domain-containing protein n=1 Tax=Lunasporangiospora selenospora TaxID=979761 RepID=A0A9P6KGM8_9FUNG|nr:hypothetical protein BGW38_007250 [Lunasporangiospora selenospora]
MGSPPPAYYQPQFQSPTQFQSPIVHGMDLTRPPSPSTSKTILTMALMEAQSAVQLDNLGDVPGALEAYSKAVVLLGKVMDSSSSTDEMERLRAINTQHAPPPRPPRPASPALYTHRREGSGSTDPSRASPVPSQGPTTTILKRTKKQVPIPPPLPLHAMTDNNDAASGPLSASGTVQKQVRICAPGDPVPTSTVPGASQKTWARDAGAVPIHSAPTSPLPPTPTALSPPYSEGTLSGGSMTSPKMAHIGAGPLSPPPGPIPIPGARTSSRQGYHRGSGGSQSSAASPPNPKSPLSQSPATTLTSPPLTPAQTRRVQPQQQQQGYIPPPTPNQSQSPFPGGAQFQAMLKMQQQMKAMQISPRYPHPVYSPQQYPLSSELYALQHQLLVNAGVHPPEGGEGIPTNNEISDLMKFYDDDEMLLNELLPKFAADQAFFAAGGATAISDVGMHDPSLKVEAPIEKKVSFNLEPQIQRKGSSRNLLSSPVPEEPEDDDETVHVASPIPGKHHHQRSYSQSSLLDHQKQLQQNYAMLRNQPSFSKLGSGVTAADKLWTASMTSVNSSLSSGSNGALTLFDVISDDPFASMHFPLPPSTLEPEPKDIYLRSYWLIRRMHGMLSKRGLLAVLMADSHPSAQHLHNHPIQSPRAGLFGGGASGGSVLTESDQDRNMISKDLETLESTAMQIWQKLSKKLPYIHRPGTFSYSPSPRRASDGSLVIKVGGGGGPMGPTGVLSNNNANSGAHFSSSASFQYHQQQQLQQDQDDHYSGSSNDGNDDPLISGFSSFSNSNSSSSSSGGSSSGGLKSQWKSFSKSVQKTMSSNKIDDSGTYTEAVTHLFQSSYILEAMLKHFTEQSPMGKPTTKAHKQVIQILERLRRLSEFLHLTICAFVIRDLGELTGKYVKRVGNWATD